MLRDARCRVDVRIERRLVTDALSRPDHVFEAPPQPVSCEIDTKDGVIPIAATMAPRIVFKDGIAVEGTPGMANVTGVNRYLALPVVEYVNRAPGIRAQLLGLINRFKERHRGSPSASTK
jgi:hypothetical protein